MGDEGGLLHQGDEKNTASAELKLVTPHGGRYTTKPKRTILKFRVYRSIVYLIIPANDIHQNCFLERPARC